MSTFCMRCGSSIDDQDQFCRKCGAQASALAAPASVTPTIPAGPAQTSGKAIASLVCGLLFFVPFAFVAAVIFGHLGLSQIRKSAGRLKGDGLAIAGLVLGYMWVVSIPIILIIAAIAIPNVMRARRPMRRWRCLRFEVYTRLRCRIPSLILKPDIPAHSLL